MATNPSEIRTPHWALLQRDDCCLCDRALALLAAARAPAFASVYIDGNAELEARYSERVPVLRNQCTGAELDWPFAPEQLRALFDAHGHTVI